MHIHSKLIQQFCKMVGFFLFYVLIALFFLLLFPVCSAMLLVECNPLFFSWSTSTLNAVCMGSFLFCFLIFFFSLYECLKMRLIISVYFAFSQLYEYWIGFLLRCGLACISKSTFSVIPFDFWTLGSLWVQFRQLLDFQIYRAFTKPVDVQTMLSVSFRSFRVIFFINSKLKYLEKVCVLKLLPSVNSTMLCRKAVGRPC